MIIVRNWLAGPRNFLVGATIYNSIGGNQKLKDLLKKGKSDFTMDLLVKEMEKLLSQEIVKPKIKPAVIETAEMPGSPDPVLEALKNEWQPLYQRMNLLRHELDKYGTDNGWEAIAYRQPRAAEIKELEQKCNQIWAKRDHYIKEGKLPFVPEAEFVIPTDGISLAKMISNMSKYIRRYRQLSDQHPDHAKYAQLLQQYRERYQRLTGYEYQEKS